MGMGPNNVFKELDHHQNHTQLAQWPWHNLFPAVMQLIRPDLSWQSLFSPVPPWFKSKVLTATPFSVLQPNNIIVDA